MLAAAVQPAEATASIGTPSLWLATIGGVIALFFIDFLITRKPHDPSMREAVGWSAFYIAIPVGFGAWLWSQYGSQQGIEYYTGYLVEKSLSVDNLFVFIIMLSSFAVPRELRQRVLLIGVAGALLLRGVFIALGTQMIASFAWTFLLFGAILIGTAIKVGRDALSHADHAVDVSQMRTIRLLRRFFPVTDDYAGTRMTVKREGRRALTPLALVTVAILGTDIVFAIDSVPAVYGITGDPYLVFATNAFALLGLRALYFVLENALASLVHLGHGLALILAFIGAKLVLHWAHGVWPSVPEIPTLLSLGVIVGILAVVTVTSLASRRRSRREAEGQAEGEAEVLAEGQPVEVGSTVSPGSAR
ncbi:tellurium resistance protein TerC [Intrasporangium oryzae NRRL B-24470]|uniref:Tellurium resistance protein TerC n=1 Tax=Intrasporangium oryzae NRRL B-24470 TaxID=1386089 RepID=W9GBE3_9MICO|nr:TerC family protein [Intrasporangium oryzae]EWT02148.1 tellurium resistance protein TerC [Intrasporangium oryzae NRRL B-24470]